jgi:hypothetical protein
VIIRGQKNWRPGRWARDVLTAKSPRRIFNDRPVVWFIELDDDDENVGFCMNCDIFFALAPPTESRGISQKKNRKKTSLAAKFACRNLYTLDWSTQNQKRVAENG